MPTIGVLTEAADNAAADALGDAVIALVRAWRMAARRTPESTQSALSVLEFARLLGEGEHRMSELAQRRGVDQSVISRQVVELEREGLVSRRPDPEDGRASLVRLTAKGLAVLANGRELRRQWLREALGRSPVDDLETTTKIVNALAEQLRAHAPELCRLAAPD